MAFNIFTNNRLENLAERLINRLEQCRQESVFTPDLVVVQSSGMQHWLRLKIAETCGICANVEFRFLRAMTDKIMFDAHVIEQQRVFSESNLQWLILQVFQNENQLNRPEFSYIRNYFEDGDIELKKFQLANRLAGVFDQYIIYRPEWLLEWENNSMPALLRNDRHALWQKELWREVVRIAGGSWHYASFKDKFLKKLSCGSADYLPSHISIFGISSMPPFFLDIISAAAEHCEVDLYYLNPCMDDWSYAYSKKEIARMTNARIPDNLQYLYSGNDLLSSLGAVGRDYFKILLDQVGLSFDDWLEPDNQYSVSDAEQPTMLLQIQNDILSLRNHNSDIKLTPDKNDDSIIINSCYSKQREIEVLFDQVMFLIKERGISPDGIAVMAPEIASYAPFIEAVFNHSTTAEPIVPYTIADRTLADGNHVIATFLKIMALHNKRFTTIEVMDIFRTPEVYRRYRLEEKDLPVIRQYIADANIRWSWSGTEKCRFDLPPIHDHSWQFGFDRLLMGLAVDSHGDELIYGIAPCSDFDVAAANAVGGFIRFVSELHAHINLMRSPQTLPEWHQILNSAIDHFFCEEKDSTEDIQQLRSQLAAMNLENAPFTGSVSATTINELLENSLAPAIQPGRFFRGGITFCALAPMRSIPFDTIILLGMDNDCFPRNPRRAGFDLREQYPRPGDISKRIEDRYIFLETIMSSRKHLIISYVGRDIKSNNLIPPSVIVSELLDYLNQTYSPAPSSTIVREHPLQPFSAEYFRHQSKLMTYSQNAWHAACSLNNRQIAEEVTVSQKWFLPDNSLAEIIELNDLEKFFKNPSKKFIMTRMNAALIADEEEELKESEDLDIAPLSKWQLADVIRKFLGIQSKEMIYQRLRASGILPYSHIGTKIFEDVYKSCSELKDAVNQLTENQAPLPPQEINIKTENGVLHGHLNSVYPDIQVFDYWSESWQYYLIQSWICHLALHASGMPPRPTCLICKKQKKFRLDPVEMENANSLLNNLLEAYQFGMNQPLCFFPKTSMEFIIKRADGKDQEEALRSAAKNWFVQPPYSNGESADPYIRQCFGIELPDTDALEEGASYITPLLDSYEQIK
ncbi:MAG: exodeoxyribonuclease V subunit gamma [Victivallaceae bacterium]|nr:exodeoxyribonuclease V subunit gamma [Victivallaceae bacterium]